MELKFVIITFSLISQIYGSICDEDKQILLDPNYDSGVPPQVVPDVNFHVTVESIRNVNDKAKTIDVELRMMVDWKDSRIGFNNSNPAVSKSVMRSRKYLSACLWYPMADIVNFVSGVQNTMFEEYQKVSLKKTPNNDEVSICTDWKYIVKVQCPHFYYVAFPFDDQFCFLVWHTPRGFSQVKFNSSVTGNPEFQNRNPNIHYAIEYKQISKEDQEHVLPMIIPSLKSEDVRFAAGIRINLYRYVFPYMCFLVAPLLCVHVTWVSYFISYESAPGRLSPIVTVILALINTIMRIQDLGNQSMDSTTIFEAYVMTCLFQVLIPLFEYWYILIRIRKERNNKISTKFSKETVDGFVRKIDRRFFVISIIVNIFLLFLFSILFYLYRIDD